MLPEVKEYRSNDYHFSVNYPADIPPQEFHERGHAFQAMVKQESRYMSLLSLAHKSPTRGS